MYEALSSDILERQYGPTELEIMFQDETTGTRVIATRAVGDKRVLEISRVAFDPDAASNFPEIYQAMLGGESMGKAFRSRGITFTRNIQSVVTCDLPSDFARWFGNTHDATVIDLAVMAGPDEKPIARILETYRPEVRWPYMPGELTMEQSEQIGLLGDFLKEQPRAG